MYSKIFRQIYDSSIADDWHTRVVFMDLLVLAESDGVIDMTPNAISARTRIPIDIVNNALTSLLQPDPESRTKDLEGRRLVLLDPSRSWGWRIVNYEKYRSIKREVDRKSYMRKYMRNYRNQNPDSCKLPVNSEFTKVNTVNSSPSAYVSVPVFEEGESVRGEDAFQAVQELKVMLASMYKRRNQLIWPQNEEQAIARIVRRDNWKDELTELQEYRNMDGKFFPRSISALLDGWDKTLDQARSQPREKSMWD